MVKRSFDRGDGAHETNHNRPGSQFWLFTLYDKDELADLSPDEKKALKGMLKVEPEEKR